MQGRLGRVRGISDEVRSELQNKLNALRHAVEEEDVDELRSQRRDVERFVDEHIAPHEKSAWREYAEAIGIAVVLALFLRAFVIEAFKIPTGSMIPTLLVGDHLFVNKFIYGIRVPFTTDYLTHFEKPKRGDVIVFSFPREEAKKHLAMQPAQKRACIDRKSLEEGEDMIKRVVGVAGDTVALKDEQLIVNGKPVKTTFLKKEITGNYMYPYEIRKKETLPDGTTYTVRYQGVGKDFPPVKVKPGHVFVMGDNRDNSSDGRCWGQVPLENIKGKALIIWWSPSDHGVRWERFGHVIH